VNAAALAWREISPAIGARVLADKAALLSGVHAAALRALLEARGVLVFPAIGFTEDEQIAFTRTLGDYAPDNASGATTAISLDPEVGANADYTRAALFWHFDGYFNAVPILASILCARVLPEAGGETQFANTYVAYDALPAADKAALEGLRAVHALAAAQRSVEPEPSHATFRAWRKVPSASLPLVWKHRSGRKSLVVGNTALTIEGMDPIEAQDLLVRLRDWATQPRFCYSHAWQEEDCVMWDNTGTLHRVLPYDAASGRLLTRTKLAGEEPFA
jgi:alpha-ketoglutarate-dependent taurine dioxygenase